MSVITASMFSKRRFIQIFKWTSLFFIPFMFVYFKRSAVYESQREKQSIDQIIQEKFSQA